MEAALKIVKILALLSVAFACAVLGVEALQVRPVLQQATATLGKVGTEVDALHGTTLALNGAVSAITTASNAAKDLMVSAKTTVDTVNQKQGILAMVYKDLNDVRTSLDVFNQTAIDEQRFLEVEQPAITAQMQTTLGHADDLIVSGNKSIADLDAAIPLLRASLVDLNAVTTAAVPAVLSVASISADAAYETHKFAHPEKKRLTFWGVLDGGALWVHSHVLPPLF